MFFFMLILNQYITLFFPKTKELRKKACGAGNKRKGEKKNKGIGPEERGRKKKRKMINFSDRAQAYNSSLLVLLGNDDARETIVELMIMMRTKKKCN